MSNRFNNSVVIRKDAVIISGMQTLKDVLKAFPLAYRKDYGGFVVVVYEAVPGVWRGRAWRMSDWKALNMAGDHSSRDDALVAFRTFIDRVREVCNAPSVPVA